MSTLRPVLLLGALTLAFLNPADGVGQDKPKTDPPKQKPPGPAFAKLLQLSPEEFLQQFDQNKDGFLTADELPGPLAKALDQADSNKDGKLDKAEIGMLQALLRKKFDKAPPPPNPEQLDQIVKKFMERLDANKDGKISKDEAMGPLAEGFAQFDANKDGFLDRDELRKFAAQFAPGVAKPGKLKPPEPGVPIPDFDAFDQNADGRLTADEVKGAPFANQFQAMDTNKDGKVDRKEFEGFFRKQAAKKDAEKKEK